MAGHLACAISNADNPVEARQRAIRKDQVNAAAFERRHKIIAALHAGGGAIDALGFQGGLNERGIVWIILQVQDVEWGFHFTFLVRAFHSGL